MLVTRMAKALRALAVAAAATLALAGPAAAQGLIRDAEIEALLRDYADPLFEAAGLDPDSVEILIVNDPTPNAFVASGQKMFIHTGLIIATETPNELIGVMAHETGHIAGGHLARSREAMELSMRPAFISIGLGILAIAAGAPDAGAALLSGAGQFAQGNFVRHTQVQESAADQAAVRYLEQTGQSGEGLISFFNREFRPSEFLVRRAPAYVLTHPFTSDRVESLRVNVEAAQTARATDSPESVRRYALMKAKLIGFLEPPGRVLAAYPESDRSQPGRYARSVSAYREARLDRAVALVQSLIDESPDNPYYNELMGQILFENGRAADSLPFNQRALELSPDAPLLKIAVARSLVGARGRDGASEALRLLQSAVAAEPDNAFAWREMAIAHDLLGQDGLARLASAEQAYALGDLFQARSFAERARQNLTEGTPSWRRAGDIIASARVQMQDENGRERPRRG